MNDGDRITIHLRDGTLYSDLTRREGEWRHTDLSQPQYRVCNDEYAERVYNPNSADSPYFELAQLGRLKYIRAGAKT